MDMDLAQKLGALLNEASRENGSNTPDFMLAEFMLSCLAAGEELVKRREQWYGQPMSPGSRADVEVAG